MVLTEAPPGKDLQGVHSLWMGTGKQQALSSHSLTVFLCTSVLLSLLL